MRRMQITEADLLLAKFENVVRLAHSLNLEPLGMGHASLAHLVFLTLQADMYVKRFDDKQKQEDYQRMWESL